MIDFILNNYKRSFGKNKNKKNWMILKIKNAHLSLKSMQMQKEYKKKEDLQLKLKDLYLKDRKLKIQKLVK